MSDHRFMAGLNDPFVLVCKRPWFAVLGLFLVFVQLLNFTGFCYRQARFYSDNELIQIAANFNLRGHGLGQERSKAYQSADDLLAQNPDCCNVYRWGHYFIEMPLVARVVGVYYAAVRIWYRIRSDGIEQFYASLVIVNACGEIIDTYGMPERDPPRR